MKYGYLFLFLLTNILWGLAFLVIKDLTNAATPVYFLLLVRFTLGTATLIALRFAIKSPKLTRSEFVQGALVGVAMFAAFNAQTWGMTATTPGCCGMLSGTYVLFVPFFLAILQRKFRWRPFVDAGISMFGFCVFFEIYRNDASFNTGDILSLISGALVAIHFILTDRFSAQNDAINFTAVQLATVAVLSLVFCALFDAKNVDPAIVVNPRYWGELVFLGVVSTGLSYWSQVLAQTKFSAETVSAVACLQSIFTVFFSVLFGFEKISLGIAVGSIVVVAATLSAALAPNSSK